MNKVTGQVKEYDFRMDWGGSSKTIESDLVVDMLVSGTTGNARVSTIITDEDSTTMRKIS